MIIDRDGPLRRDDVPVLPKDTIDVIIENKDKVQEILSKINQWLEIESELQPKIKHTDIYQRVVVLDDQV